MIYALTLGTLTHAYTLSYNQNNVIKLICKFSDFNYNKRRIVPRQCTLSAQRDVVTIINNTMGSRTWFRSCYSESHVPKNCIKALSKSINKVPKHKLQKLEMLQNVIFSSCLVNYGRSIIRI